MANVEDRLRYDKDTSRLLIDYKEGVDETLFVVSPRIPVPQTFRYAKYTKGNNVFAEDTTRATGNPNVKRLVIDGATWFDKELEEHSLEDFLDRRYKGRSGVVQGLFETDMLKKGRRIKNMLDVEQTKKIIAKVQSINASYKTTPTTKWNDTGGDPVAELIAAKEAMFANCGKYPSHIVIPQLVLSTIANIVRAKYTITSFTKNSAIVEQILLDDLGIPATNLLIPSAGNYNGTTAVYEQLWGDSVLMFFTMPLPVEDDIVFMGTFIADDVPEYRQLPVFEEPNHKTGDVVQGIKEYFIDFIAEDAGYWIYTCLL